MEKILFILLLFLFLLQPASAQNPEKIYGKNKVLKSNDYYLEQMQLWRKEAETHPQNPDAWYNYYRSSRNAYIVGEENDSQNAKSTNRFQRLKTIVLEMEKNVPGSYEFNFVKWLNGNNDELLFPYLEKANTLNPEAPEPVMSLVYYYELKGDYARRDKYLQDFYALGDYSPGLLNYAYNMLMEPDSNAIIFTHGDKDTDASFILQAAKGIRTDVRLINVDLFMQKDYRLRLFKELEIPGADIDPFLSTENYDLFRKTIILQVAKNAKKRPVYIGVLVPDAYTEEVNKKMYLAGLSYLLSDTSVDNFTLLKKNYEEKFALDYLRAYLPYDISEGNMHEFNANYLLSLDALRGFYLDRNDKANADKYNTLMMKIINDTGHPQDFKKYIHQ